MHGWMSRLGRPGRFHRSRGAGNTMDFFHPTLGEEGLGWLVFDSIAQLRTAKKWWEKCYDSTGKESMARTYRGKEAAVKFGLSELNTFLQEKCSTKTKVVVFKPRFISPYLS